MTTNRQTSISFLLLALSISLAASPVRADSPGQAETRQPASRATSGTVGESADSSSLDESESTRRAEIEAKKLARITVTGNKEASLTVPGAADIISGKAFEEAKGATDDINQVLRRVPGVNLQEEEGYGLRPNIGIRGADSNRSQNITVMEDGVLIAPAPYSAPAAYYFPSVGRLAGVEVTKGAGTIKYGPRTTGGSLNLLSTSIPEDSLFSGSLKGGTDDTLIGHVAVGKSFTYGGFLLEGYQAHSDGFKNLDGGGDTGFNLQDVLGKFKLNTAPSSEYYQEIELKLQSSDQDADETYLGLTKSDFDDNPFRRYRASQLDNLNVEHEQVQVRHYGELGEGIDVTTTFYNNSTSRLWRKLESINGVSASDVLDDPSSFSQEYSWITGEDSAEGVFALRNNRRSYRSTGVQSVLALEHDLGFAESELEIGARFHYDYEDRFQEEDKYSMSRGDLLLASAGAPGSHSNRKGETDAFAIYVRDELTMGDFSVTPGLRYERMNFKNQDWGKTDPTRSGSGLKSSYRTLDALIPGVGVRYSLTEVLSTYASIHKGFAPPGPSASSDVDEEESINYELGLSANEGSLAAETTLFVSDYKNLLGADSASSGGSGSGDLFDAGKASVWGLEASLAYDLGAEEKWAVGTPMYLTYTYTDAEFDSSFSNDVYGDVLAGDEIPYIAPHQVSAGVALDHEKVRLGLDMYYVDSMPTAGSDAGIQNTDAHVVFDLEIAYKLKEDSARIFVLVQNLFDEEYIVAARPAGARPGMPQTVLAGVKFSL